MNSETGKTIWKRNKTIAILLAVFFGPWTWLYTYRRDPGKAAIGLGININVLMFVTWIIQTTQNTSTNSQGPSGAGEAAAYAIVFLIQVMFLTWVFAITVTAMRKEWHVDYQVSRNKLVGVLLAVFLGPWTWLYTYRKDFWKFWPALVFSTVCLAIQLVDNTIEWVIPLWLIGSFAIWITSIINAATRKMKFIPQNAGVLILEPNAIVESTELSSNKSRFIAAFLAIVMGTIGAHRLYVGKIKTGLLLLVVSLTGIAIDFAYPEMVFGNRPVGLIPTALVFFWSLIDFCIIVAGRFKDKEGKYVTHWGEAVS